MSSYETIPDADLPALARAYWDLPLRDRMRQALFDALTEVEGQQPELSNKDREQFEGLLDRILGQVVIELDLLAGAVAKSKPKDVPTFIRRRSEAYLDGA